MNLDDLWIFHFPIAGTQPGSPKSTSHTLPIPYSFAYDRPSALSLIGDLNILCHPEKGQDFGTSFKYIGFLWSI